VTIVERAWSPRGEVVLRRVGDHLEIISNGTFLMDTRDGRSERLLVDAGIAACRAPAPRVLIGGLGVGFSLVAAVAHEHVIAIDVVEVEPTIVAWHATHLRHLSADALADPRVHVATVDLADFLTGAPEPYDLLCLDIDNGPDWTVVDANAAMYGDRGLALVRRNLRPHGVLTVWSARRVPDFEDRLGTRFGEVHVHEVPVARGEPDVVYVAY
jgi:spermidine synthase